jgi:RNA polymerase sigma-70 factor, ECF subfamily
MSRDVVLRERVACVSERDELGELSLLEAARLGDAKAFSELYRRHAGWAYARLTRLIGPVPERDDLLQEIFLDLHRALARFRGDARLATFLHRIIVNVSCDHLTRFRRRAWLPLAEAQLDELVEGAVSPEVRAEQRQQVAEALMLLATLKPKKRIAFVLVAIEGMTLAEAAAVVGAAEDTVKQRVLHARRELAQKCARRERQNGGVLPKPDRRKELSP